MSRRTLERARSAIGICATLAITAAPHAIAEAPAGTALIIANTHEETPHAQNDANAFERFLLTTRHFAPEHVHLLDNADASTVSNALQALAHPHLVVYFSGHADDDENPIDALLALTDRAGATSIEMFIEGPQPPNTTIDAWARSGTRTALIAASPGEQALRDEHTRLGLFTAYLLEALHGWADDGDNQVSAAEADAYLTDTLAAYVARALGQTQTPVLIGDSEAILADALPPRPPPTPPVVANADAVPATPWATEQALALGNDERKLIQRGLAAAGLDVGPIDGLLGPRTRGAITAWERTQGRTPNGHLDTAEALALIALGREGEKLLEPPKVAPEPTDTGAAQ